MASAALRTSYGQDTIDTVAGGGVGDGLMATAASLSSPNDVSALVSTNSGGMVLYIADRSNHRIRRVDEDGNIITVAGTGTGSFSGDGSAATAAMLNNPFAVSALFNASSGGVELYITDSSNHRIRCVDEGGNITTVVGTGTSGFSGDGGPATVAKINLPYGMSVLFNTSSGGVVLYFADTNNNRIRRVGEDGIITTVAGSAFQGFSGDGGAATAARLFLPYGVAAWVNPSSGGVVLYIADSNNNRIRRVSEDGNITTVAGTGTSGFSGDGGAATAAKLNSPYGMSALTNPSSGGVVLFIADTFNNCIRRVDEGGNITTVAGTGTAGFSGNGGAAAVAKLNSPRSSFVWRNASSGGVVLYIADSGSHCIRRVGEDSVINSVAGTGSSNFGGDGGAATGAALNGPRSASVWYNASSGGVELYIADSTNHRIRRVDEAGAVTSVVGNGTAGYGGDEGEATAAVLNNPYAVSSWYNATSGGMVLFIADSNNHRIRRVDEDGNIITVAGTGTGSFSGDGGAATAATLKNPSGMSTFFNISSGGVVLYIADTFNNRIRRVSEDGNITTVAGTGT
ncbi:hypothetical protein EON62_00575, partial [archaeon]